MRSFKLNDQQQVVTLQLCSHLSPQDIAALKRLKTLETLVIGGSLPYSRIKPPTEAELKAEELRLREFPSALSQLRSLTSIRHLHLRHVPSKEETQTVLAWRQLETLTGEIPSEHYPDIARLTRLQHLSLSGTDTKSVSPQFLTPLAKLQSLKLHAGFGDDTFEYLADKRQLTKIQGDGLSGEAHVDYLTQARRLRLLHALRGAGYWVTSDSAGRITKLHFAYTKTFDRLFSEKVLSMLPNIREMSFTHIGARDEQVLRAIRGRSLESLNLTNVGLRPSVMTEFCKLKSLKNLSISFSAKKIELPAISGLPMLESLAVGGINDWKTRITSVRDLPRLERLAVYGCDIQREHAEQISQLPNLKQLALTGGSVSQEAVKVIATMSRLEHIDLSKTSIGDQQLQLLTGLKHLKVVKTTGSQVSVNARARFLREHLGYGPMKILLDAGVRCRRENSKRITHISFGKTCGSELLRSAAALPAVTHVKFVMTKLDGDDLLPLASMQRVEDVKFIHCKKLDDPSVTKLAEMPALRSLTILSSGITDDSKPELLKLTQLESLEVRGKSVSPTVVAEVRRQLPNIRE